MTRLHDISRYNALSCTVRHGLTRYRSLHLSAPRRSVETGHKGSHFRPRVHDTLVHIPKSNVYRLGDPNNASPVFRDLQWTVKEGESWAVIGSGSGQKTTLLEMLLGHHRISPFPPNGLFPFLTHPHSGVLRAPHNSVHFVSFAHRPSSRGGDFYDYTARYGAVWEEDRVTLRQTMSFETLPPIPPDHMDAQLENEFDALKEQDVFKRLMDEMGLAPLLDLPLVALSNGQTRRARVVKAVLSQPELLLLDEPLTGLDSESRPALLSMLHSLHKNRRPRIIIGLRNQDPLPDWVTHVAVVQDATVYTMEKRHYRGSESLATGDSSSLKVPLYHQRTTGEVIVVMKNVNVAYQAKAHKVLENINWTIREGERWHLQGANGSGKTTLLALITGDHPQSYTQTAPFSALMLFGRPRRQIPTAMLRDRIGVFSPELFNAFPRRRNLSVFEAVATGFDGGFVPLGKDGLGIGREGAITVDQEDWRRQRVREVIAALGPAAVERTRAESHGHVSSPAPTDMEYERRVFVDMPAAEQSIVLLMRALVGHHPLVLLDEVWSGMDDAMVETARRYLRNGAFTPKQAVIVISHWNNEVPWTEEEGVKRLVLHHGHGKVILPRRHDFHVRDQE